jgi:hypothetical protein
MGGIHDMKLAKSLLIAGLVAGLLMTVVTVSNAQPFNSRSGRWGTGTQATAVVVPQPTPAASADSYGAGAALKDNDLTMVDMLTYAIQDEYLARGEYDYVLAKLGQQRPFSNIVGAEDSHISELTALLNTYGIAIPENKAAEHLKSVETTSQALAAGAQAEVDNIAMYERFLKQDLPADVRAVFTELRDASKNHLNAFTRSRNW